MKKTCLVCKQNKDNMLFAKDKKHTNGTKNICLECVAMRAKIYYAKHKTIRQEAAKKYRERNRERIAADKKKWSHSAKALEYRKIYWARPEVQKRFRFQQWKRKYGLSTEEAEKMLQRQENKCCICGELLKTPYLDHCHATQKVRGFLCAQCNVGLGSFRDNINYLLNASKYLDDFNKRILASGKVV